ncbi:restriction endonuclease [Reticulibacter mediterranei]|uniref:Type I restriction enzyme endonuclease subunit n=1 Tax=Reticulibacter mediterranei TaxID=2778369 RepID=A0A8J3IT08_9CHLR|nr:HsdR family type I site-specific deoxyribonuclease [Reticulibacter mediterranei]GHO96267.1 restriction endonuclease [Reticulibacter mediterranei]
MSIVGQIERITQNRVVKLFRDQLHYTYLGNKEKLLNNRNIEEALLLAFLKKQGYSNDLINRATYEFMRIASDQNRSLYDINKDVYELLRYGVKIKLGAGDKTETVWLIDWKKRTNNDFYIAEEVTVRGPNDKRPDIVLYVNGIALGVLELKRAIVGVAEGIRQNLDNQDADYIQRFFTTVQLVMAGNDTEGLYYGTTGTPEKQYDFWKEESTIANVLDRHLTQLCSKERLLEIIHDFVIFDHGIKKVCRPHQYFGVRAAQQRIKSREGGIIWHSQGSGKSLTMVWLAKWIRENVTNARVLIITDRTELDEQIEKIFLGVEEKIVRTKSGKDLVNKLGATSPWLICSLIHKFGRKAGKNGTAEEGDVDAFIADVKSNLPPDFKAQGDIYVFVDECHRTQSGKLREAMKDIVLPHAMYIGFTGTPLLKTDKQTSTDIFGTYIHEYRFDDAVRDKVVLDLCYEARDINQYIGSQERIDRWFDIKTRGLTDAARARLKQKWGTMQKVLSSEARLKMIVDDILHDMDEKPRLMSGRGNALLVVDSIYQACKIYELFINEGFNECAIVTSYKPSKKEIKGERTGEGRTEKQRQYDIYIKMLNGKTPEDFEKEVKQKFVEQPGQMRLLIVVDKLLTGFDAPSATYLYIDKQMHNHGLFQAICRVNRLDGEDKDYGYIVDYQNLFKSLEGSIRDYTSEALSGYDKKDVDGLLKDRIAKGREQLENAREQIKALCEPVDLPRATEDYLRYFCTSDTTNGDELKDNEPKRAALYKLTVALIRAYSNLANDMPEAGYSEQESQKIKDEVVYYTNVRTEVKRASGDFPDLKLYEPAMRHLIDTYIRADESQKISDFDDISLVQLIVERGVEGLEDLPPGIKSNQGAMAETIENNLRRVIIDETPTNPMYYEKMSEVLDTLTQERRQKAKDYQQYLKEIIELTRLVYNPAGAGSYPPSLNTRAKRALYTNLGNDEKLALAVDAIIRQNKRDGWKGSIVKEKEVLYAIQDLLQDDDLGKRIFDLAKNQDEY